MGTCAPLSLGGFKILDQVLWTPLAETGLDGSPGREFCSLLSTREVNLPFLTLERSGPQTCWNIVFGSQDAPHAGAIFPDHILCEEGAPMPGAVLSLFPHRNDPIVAGRLIQAFARAGIWPYVLAYSPSALSVVVPAAAVAQATEAIFGPFCFGTFHTPVDWRLAQQGKEALFKEVVASFSEKRPKVYGLRWSDNLRLFILDLEKATMPIAGRILEALAATGGPLHFLMSSLSDPVSRTRLLIAVPEEARFAWSAAIGRGADQEGFSASSRPAALFTMNGPHFGDRYGITSILLQGFEGAGVHLLALNCSVASITGLVAPEEADQAVAAITQCFEVPAVIKLPA